MTLAIDKRNILIVLGISILFGASIVRYNLLIIPVLAGLTFLILSFCKYEFIFSLGLSAFVFYNLVIIHLGPFDGKPYQIIWSIAFIAYFLRSLYHGERILKFDKIDIPLFALLAAYVLSIISSVNPAVTFRECIQLLYFILLFKIICSSIQSKEEMTRVFRLIIIFGILFITIGILTLILGRSPFPQLLVDIPNKKVSWDTSAILFQQAMRSAGEATFERISSCFLGYVETANIACQMLLIFLALIGGKHLIRKRKIIFSLAFLLGGILLLFTFSRAGILIFMLSAILLMYFRRQFKSIFIFSLILLSIFIISKPLNSRMKEAGSLEQDSTKGHMAMYWAAWKLFTQSPLYGIGAGAFGGLNDTAFARDIKKQFHVWGWADTHNLFLQRAAETGIIGLMSLISLIAIFFYSIIKAIRIEEDGYYRDILIGLALANFCAILMNLTMNAFMVETFWVMFAVSYAAASLAGPSPLPQNTSQ